MLSTIQPTRFRPLCTLTSVTASSASASVFDHSPPTAASTSPSPHRSLILSLRHSLISRHVTTVQLAESYLARIRHTEGFDLNSEGFDLGKILIVGSNMSASDSTEDDESPVRNMKTISHHSFGDKQGEPEFSISIVENMKEEYGLYVWPCSVVLAEYVWQQRSRFARTNVLEVGAGTALPGLVAAKLGANVTLTDDAIRIEVLDNMRQVCQLNILNCQVMGLSWGVWDETLFSLHPQFILGADVLYEASAFDDLFATVSFILQNSPGSVFITTYHNRSGHHLIGFLMEKWGLKCSKLLDGYSIMPSSKASRISGNIQLAEIVLNADVGESRG